MDAQPNAHAMLASPSPRWPACLRAPAIAVRHRFVATRQTSVAGHELCKMSSSGSRPLGCSLRRRAGLQTHRLRLDAVELCRMSSSGSRSVNQTMPAPAPAVTLLAPTLAPTAPPPAHALRPPAPAMMTSSGLTGQAAAYGTVSRDVAVRRFRSHSPMPRPWAISEHAANARVQVHDEPNQIKAISSAMMFKE